MEKQVRMLEDYGFSEREYNGEKFAASGFLLTDGVDTFYGEMVGDMKKQFDEFIAEMGGTPSPDPMERPLATQDARLEVWLSKERHELVVKKTVNLKDTPDYGTEISNLEAELRRCLLINRTSLLNASRVR